MRRVGLWFIGAFGGVGATAALGLAGLVRDRTKPVGLVTALPPLADLNLDPWSAFVVGGHDVRTGSLTESARGLHQRSGIFADDLINSCREVLDQWSGNVRGGTTLQTGPTIAALADSAPPRETPRAAVARIQADIDEFQRRHELADVVVVNVASTEPPFELGADHQSFERLHAALDRPDILPASGLYACAALERGWPYINFTPSLGCSLPALTQVARQRGAVYAGKDGKTGETLLKSVLAPMFAARNLKVLSWVGHNILGGGDGRVLADPINKASKVRSKDALLAEILGYKPQTHISIDPRVAECGDGGEPIVRRHLESPVAQAYLQLASRMMTEISRLGTGVLLPSVQL